MSSIDEIRALAAKHRLSFTFNPGGGEFYRDDLGRCQIHTYDDAEDLGRLRAWLKERGLELDV
jgi:hypothetical protein